MKKVKNILSTLYTNSRFYSSMDGLSKEDMIKYNKLCTSVRGNTNSLFEDWFSQVMQERRNESSEERGKVSNENCSININFFKLVKLNLCN